MERVFKEETTLALLEKPEFKYGYENTTKYAEFDLIVEFIYKLRSIRGLFAIDPVLFRGVY
jgi:hypothetical protein